MKSEGLVTPAFKNSQTLEVVFIYKPDRLYIPFLLQKRHMVGRSLNIPWSQNQRVFVTYFLLSISPLHPYQTKQWQNSNFVDILILVVFILVCKLGSAFQFSHSKNTLLISMTLLQVCKNGKNAKRLYFLWWPCLMGYYTNTQLDIFHWFGWNRIINFVENIYLWCTAATLPNLWTDNFTCG